jgi:hypothetical protein
MLKLDLIKREDIKEIIQRPIWSRFGLRKPKVTIESDVEACQKAFSNVCAFIGTRDIIQEHIVSTFRPWGSLDRRVKLSLRAPAQMGWRKMEHKGGKTVARVILRQGDALAVGVTSAREGERERGSRFVSPSSHAMTPLHEGPGPSFYRCKERVQMYNGGVAMR